MKLSNRARAKARWWRRHDRENPRRQRTQASALLSAWRVVDTDLTTHALTDTTPPLVACTGLRLVGERWLAILNPGEDAWPVSVDCPKCVHERAYLC